MPLARISPTRCTRQLHQIPGVYQGHLPTEATPSKPSKLPRGGWEPALDPGKHSPGGAGLHRHPGQTAPAPSLDADPALPARMMRSLASYIHSTCPDLSPLIWAVDIRRDKGPLGQDMLQPPLWNHLCSLAAAGLLLFIGGGPNCRTWSILRWFPRPNAPRPVRGRSEQHVWGLPSNTAEDRPTRTMTACWCFARCI